MEKPKKYSKMKPEICPPYGRCPQCQKPVTKPYAYLAGTGGSCVHKGCLVAYLVSQGVPTWEALAAYDRAKWSA
jgi:hypothetical protein